jgi:hypothetical protein
LARVANIATDMVLHVANIATDMVLQGFSQFLKIYIDIPWLQKFINM